MKKLLLLGAVFVGLTCCLHTRLHAQTVSTPTLVFDTLHYYLNKFYFKSPTPSIQNFPFYKSAASTATSVTHVGNKFENPDSVVVFGLESFVYKAPTTASLKIRVHLYLCSLQNNLPAMPPIDSVISEVGFGATQTPSLVGGNFPNGREHTLKQDYAVLIRNMSTIAGDTVFIVRTAGVTQTNTTAQWTEKCSDSYGYVRYNAQFHSATNYTALGFGYGTDYEFVIAPRVKYEITVGHIPPAAVVNSETVCTRTDFQFTNISSKYYTHRMYNLNEFYRKWNNTVSFQSQPQVGGGFSADTSITWYFEFDDNAMPPRDPRRFLPYGGTGITWSSDMPGCMQNNELRARWRPMQAFGRGTQQFYNEKFKICMEYCNDDVGIRSAGALTQVSLAPNPMNEGHTTLSGLHGNTLISISNILGQVLLSKEVREASADIDLSSYPKGTYFLKLSSGENTRTIKVLNQ